MYRYSKTLENLAKAHPEKISEYHCDTDGHWLYLHNGWSCVYSGVPCVHETLISLCIERFLDIELLAPIN